MINQKSKKLTLGLLLFLITITSHLLSIEKPKEVPSTAQEEKDDKPAKKTGLNKGWEAIPGNMESIDMVCGGENPLVVGINAEGEPHLLDNDWKTWVSLRTAGGVGTQLFPGTIIALESLTDDSSQQGKLLQMHGKYLKATGTDPNDKSCQFEVLRILSWTGLKSLATGKNLQVPVENQDTHVARTENTNFHHPNHNWEHFSVMGTSLEKAFFKSRATQGFLSVRPETDVWSQGGKVWTRDDSNKPTQQTAKESFKIHIVKATSGSQNKFKHISIGSDMTVVGVTEDEKIWLLDGITKTWSLLITKLSQVSVGNSNELWGINNNSILYRKKNNETITDAHWQQLPNKGISISCGGDGYALLAGADQKIYHFNRFRKQWEELIRPAGKGMGSPYTIKVKDHQTAAFLDYQNRVWKLKPGKEGKEGDDWAEVSDGYKVKDFAVGHDGTIIIITVDDKILVKKPTKEEAKELALARGAIIHAGQILQLKAGANNNGQRVWTHAGSHYDHKATQQPPNNHLEILIGTGANDYRQDAASFFMITPKDNPEKNDPIRYGDTVSIWSLYAAPGNTKKAGILSKEWKWWSHSPHFKWGNTHSDIVVSLVSNPNTQNGFQDFKIVSPTGKTGFVHSNDIIEIVSLAPHSKDQHVWGHPWSRWGGPYWELLINSPSNDDLWGYKNDYYGKRDIGGYQLFQFKAINKKEDLPTIKKSGNNLTPHEVFEKIQNNYFKDKTVQQAVKEKAVVKADHKDGIGLFREIRNHTEFDIDAGDLGTIQGQDTIQGINRELFETLVLKGFAKEAEVKDFGPAKMITIDRLMSKGAAWITESLKTPGQATITFLAKGQDEGNIQIIFNTKLEPNHLWKVIIGGWNNKKSAIVRDTKIMAEADSEVTPLARVAPGRFTPYWVSINNGIILVGVGMPGENIFMSCNFQNPEPIDRVGFSCHDGNVEYTEVEVSEALTPHPDNNKYNAKLETIILPATPETLIPLDLPLRVANEGTIAFQAKAKHSVALVLENDAKEQYKIIIGANRNKNFHILKKDKVALEMHTEYVPSAGIKEDTPTEYWVTLDSGKILVGKGKIGQGLFAVWQDQEPLQNVTKIGFVAADHPQEISNIEFSPPVTIGTKSQKTTYEKIIKRFPYKGSLLLIRYFHWVFVQDGQRIGLKDMVTGQSFHIFPTPQQGARYILKLDILETGMPDVMQLEGPKESPEKIDLQRNAALADIDAEKRKDIGEGLFKATGAMTGFAGGGGKGALIATGVGALFAGGGALAHGLGAAKAADAAKMRLKAEMGYRSHDSEVFTELVERAGGLHNKIPEAAQENKQIVTNLLAQARKLSYNNKQHLEQLIPIYIDILRRVSHSYVVEDQATKQSIYDALDAFQKNYGDHKDLYPKVMNLFVKAFSNTFLIDKNSREEVKRRDRWYQSMIDIGTYVFEQCLTKDNFEIELEPLFGEYLWIPRKLKEGRGTITFEVRGQNDLFICLAQEDYKVKDLHNNIYEFDFGAWENEKIEVRIRSLGKAAVEISRSNERFKNAMLNPRRFQQYWISFDNGLIKIGQGSDIGKNTLITWKDPFPWDSIQYIGFGTWDVPISLKNIRVGNLAPTATKKTQSPKQKGQSPRAAPKKIVRQAVRRPVRRPASRPIVPKATPQTEQATQGSVKQTIPKLEPAPEQAPTSSAQPVLKRTPTRSRIIKPVIEKEQQEPDQKKTMPIPPEEALPITEQKTPKKPEAQQEKESLEEKKQEEKEQLKGKASKKKRSTRKTKKQKPKKSKKTKAKKTKQTKKKGKQTKKKGKPKKNKKKKAKPTKRKRR